MRACFAFLLVGTLNLVIPSSRAATLFEDGFETGQLGAPWSVSTTSQGRAEVSTANAPATGSYHLILDDSVSDVTYSVAEATISLNLTNKRNVILSFKAKSLDNDPHTPPTGNFTTTRAYDGVAISTNGGATWRTVQSLATVGTAWESFSISLDSSVALLAGTFGADFRIRFSGYDNAPVPLDGLAIDDVTITGDEDQRTVLELPVSLVEGSGPHTGYVLLAFPPSAPLTLTLSSSPTGQLTLPATVTIPAGESFASFQFSVVEDSLFNLTRSVSVSATATAVTASPSTISITDNDVPVATLTIPAQLTEGVTATNNASVSIDRVSSVALTFTLSSSPTGELTLPASVTIPAGQTQILFTAVAVNDTKIDGNIPITVTAAASGIASATAQTTAVDNEIRALGLTLPTTAQEGGTASGTVTVPGTLTTALNVTLTSANEASLTVPTTVTILAGQTQATFTITAVDNAVRDGSRSVSLTAAATTFTGTSKAITVRDNDAASYRFGTLGALLNISSAVSTSVQALDIEGNAIAGFSGVVNLSVVLPDSSTSPLTPATATFSGASWTGNVTLPNLTASPLKLRASDANGNTGESTSFDVMRSITQQAADLVWDSTRNVIYASIPAAATGSYANKVIAIDPVTLQVTGSVTTNQDPGQLALTSGNEALFVALKANGTVAKIDLSTLTINSTFAVGTDASYGTLYAEDICTVAGQPNLLVVSQYRKGVSPRHNGVAVYDNGVRRANKTQDHTGSNIIEPSADPTIYFGFNIETSEYGFRRLKLDANGLTQFGVNTTLLDGFSKDMRSAGDKVYSTSGIGINGALMTRIGSFGTSGQVYPDLASNRIYYIEPLSQWDSTHDKISAYDPTTFSLIRSLSFPSTVTSPASFIRWGATGLAFRTSTSIYLINSSQIVPSDPPANLAVTVQATPNPATVAAPLTYTIHVINQGPNIARSTFLNATFSDSQTIQTATASVGTPSTSGLAVSLPVGDLASGASATLSVSASPQSAGSLTCSASVSSNAVDPDFTNNTGSKLVSVGFVPAVDVVNQLRLPGNNVVADATRNLLWVSIPSTVAAPLGKTIVSVNPSTGLMSDPIPLNASPKANSMALSANGRYLYVGLSDLSEVLRVDLNASPVTITHLPLGLSQWGSANYAQEIEVLDGSDTSFVMTGSDDHSAAVYDGSVMRTNRSGIYTVDRLERTGTANTFVGYHNSSSGFETTRLAITASGINITQSVSNLISGYSAEIRGSGDVLLSSTGKLINSNQLTLISTLPATGRPCVDGPYQRAYLVTDNTLNSFDAMNGTSLGSLTLPTASTGDWAQSCIRYGVDGFAVLGTDKLYLTRWSAAIPAGFDTNNNGLADNWEATNFGVLGVNPMGDIDGDGIADGLEYLFGSSPNIYTSNPIQINTDSVTGQNMIHLIFPRRTGLSQGQYGYECSVNLTNWYPVLNVSETVVSSQTVNGVLVETIDAQIPCPMPTHGFVRLKWSGL